jgi:hypothetical protein
MTTYYLHLIFSSDAWYLRSKFSCSQHADCSVLRYTPWNLHDSYACFGENYCLHLVPWKQRQQVPPKSWHLFMKLHGFKSLKPVIFIFTATRTPNLMLKDYYWAWKRVSHQRHQPPTSVTRVRFPLKLHGFCSEQSGTRAFPPSPSVSPVNSRSTNCSMCTNNTTTRRYTVSRLNRVVN